MHFCVISEVIDLNINHTDFLFWNCIDTITVSKFTMQLSESINLSLSCVNVCLFIAFCMHGLMFTLMLVSVIAYITVQLIVYFLLTV